MRASLLAFALLLALDGALFWGARRLSGEREALRSRRADLSERLEAARKTGEDERRIGELIDRASPSMKYGASDIASLRDLLIAAERGLDIDRFSLDFRSGQEGLSASNSGRVGASLGGTFEAVYDYLERVERLRLPLVPEELSLRVESSGRILLGVQWLALWGAGEGTPPGFSAAEVGRLEAWLAREPQPRPGRDPFSGQKRQPELEEMPRVSDGSPLPAEPPTLEAPLVATGAEVPQLVGFVLARPELESDVSRRVLAALRFQGELVLVGVGEVVGDFRVERIDARESAVLIHLQTGEPLTLLLE